MMNGIYMGILVWNVYALLIFRFANSYHREPEVFASTLPDEVFKSESTVRYKYERMDEVKKQCRFVLNSASVFKPDDNRKYSIKEELYFVNGDWVQAVGEAPLLPFDGREVSKNLSDLRTPLNLVSFWVTDVSHSYQSKKSVAVSGLLSMGITIDGSFVDRPYEESHQFEIWHSHTQLWISFQGIYTEKGDERVMCLLGSTVLPAREPGSPDPWQWVTDVGYNYNQPPLLQDDQILLVIRYPMTLNLTSREVRGEMKSLNPKSNLKYFDEVHISSQLVKSNYEFGAEKLVSRACDPYPYKDSLMNGGIDFYKGNKFCKILEQVINDRTFFVVPNWRCNGTDDFCSTLGPFGSNKEVKATDGSFKGVKLFMQNVNCEETTERNVSLAKVSAVFRVVPPSQSQYSSAQRCGLNNMTAAVEGIWKSSSGQLCMVGCIGLVDSEQSSCNSRVCLYIPLKFSIKQRSILVGSFSSINNSNMLYFPLSFEKLVQPMELWNYFKISPPYYSYSKIDLAGVILEKNEPFSFRTVIKKSLLRFPKLEDTDSFLTSLSFLSEDLTLHISAVPDRKSNAQFQKTDMQMEILSIGPLFGHYWSSNFSTTAGETPYHNKAEYTEKQLLLNVSAQLALSGKNFNNFSVLFLEGLYDPHVGKMYLVGCRDVRASWNILFESNDLEAGLDCLIEVVVSYPSMTAWWLVNPTARISISSTRNEDDPLYFSMIKLETFPILYRKQREDILSRQGVEGILRILTLSVAISCILSELFYIHYNMDAVPYISLTMLGVQALGYSLPLVTSAEAVFQRMASERYDSSSYGFEKNQWLNVVDYTVKLLVLVSFLLTLRLCQKVWKSRIRLLNRAPLEPHRIPSEKWVVVSTVTLHLIGYVTVLFINSVKSSQKGVQMGQYQTFEVSSNKLQEWEIELVEYVGLVHDLFLLPQVIGNLVWQLDCKPLRKLYFMGMTLVRLLPHAYDYLRVPTPLNPYFSEQYEFVNQNLDFYSKFGDIAIPATAIFLVISIYIQQRWNYEKLSHNLRIGQHRLLPVGSKMYERLPSQSFEAELVPGVNANTRHDKDKEQNEDV